MNQVLGAATALLYLLFWLSTGCTRYGATRFRRLSSEPGLLPPSICPESPWSCSI